MLFLYFFSLQQNRIARAHTYIIEIYENFILWKNFQKNFFNKKKCNFRSRLYLKKIKMANKKQKKCIFVHNQPFADIFAKKQN